MEKILLVLLVTFLSQLLKSQVVFCPPGAEWRYIFGKQYYAPGNDNIVKYVCDSIVNNETVKVLTHSYFYKLNSEDYCHKTLIKQRGDTIFMRNCNTSDTWQVLYNFAATAGQSWITTVKDSAVYGSHTAITHTVYVNLVTTTSINNMILKKLLVAYCYISPASGQLKCDAAEITERTGCDPYLFNYANSPANSNYDKLLHSLCYKDNTFGVKEDSFMGCNYTVGITNPPLSSAHIRLYPNPVTNFLNIDLTGAALADGCTVNIINALGQAVLSPGLQSINGELTLDVSSLGSGVYFLQVFNKGSLAGVQKLVKE